MTIKKELPTMSFCMPNYNDGDTIGMAIESIFDQDYPNIEMIICDDGSTDNSKEVLKKYEKKFKKLKVIHSRHKGACIARNLAAKEATGKYLSFLPADAILYPGVVRTWINHLEDNELDFIYGGYRFVEENTRKPVMNYFAEPFDEYFLKVSNYIDGSFPIKKDLFDKMGGWDANIKSLQDWDLWLNAVINHKAKGMYLPEIFFETTMPHAGGLSDDSSKNWESRVKQIKKKYKIEEKDICVTSKGAEFHGKQIAKILNADYKTAPEFKPHDYKMIYQLGFYPSIADQCGAVFNNHKGLRVVHWIGSDVMQLQELPTRHKKLLLEYLDNNVDIHLSEFKTTQKELSDEGIKSRIMPLPPKVFYDVKPLPKDFTVAVYMPQMNQQHYLPEFIDELAKKARNVKFKLFGDITQMGTKGNIEYLGRINKEGMQNLINNSNCLLRVLRHDGLSINVEEFLCAGRQVVTNIQNIQHTHEVPVNINEIIKTFDKIRKIKNPDIKASKYWCSKLSHKKFKKFFDNILECNQKEYWDKRAESWNTMLEDNVYDKDKVLQELKKLNPKSILDIGCGNGNWTKILSDELPKVPYLGIDISKEMIKYAKKRNPKKEFKIKDLTQLLNIDKYDLGFAYTCFLHISPKDMEKAIENIKQYCKRLLIIEPIKRQGVGKMRFLHPDALKAQKKGLLLMHPNSSYIHNYDKYFKIKKRIDLGERTLFIIDL